MRLEVLLLALQSGALLLLGVRHVMQQRREAEHVQVGLPCWFGRRRRCLTPSSGDDESGWSARWIGRSGCGERSGAGVWPPRRRVDMLQPSM